VSFEGFLRELWAVAVWRVSVPSLSSIMLKRHHRTIHHPPVCFSESYGYSFTMSQHGGGCSYEAHRGVHARARQGRA
jgi:hypothetical protein